MIKNGNIETMNVNGGTIIVNGNVEFLNHYGGYVQVNGNVEFNNRYAHNPTTKPKVVEKVVTKVVEKVVEVPASKRIQAECKRKVEEMFQRVVTAEEECKTTRTLCQAKIREIREHEIQLQKEVVELRGQNEKLQIIIDGLRRQLDESKHEYNGYESTIWDNGCSRAQAKKLCNSLGIFVSDSEVSVCL